MTLTPKQEYDLCVEQIQRHNSREKWAIWYSAPWCYRVVGNYQVGETQSVAETIGKSRDTVEDRAHMYTLFLDLCKIGPEERYFVHMSRRLPYVHPSHFNVMYDIRERYGLDNRDILHLLMDIVQNEGSLSSRDLDKHARDRFGVDRPWDWYAGRAMPNLWNIYNHEDTPGDVRKMAGELWSKLGDQ